ncbi:MAG: FliM/FliN family flagellar motor switch protein [Planctomycetes bacterium]|nr:FliM/FliN family flagellar motor switch protein [Planctomycetota bacterium]
MVTETDVETLDFYKAIRLKSGLNDRLSEWLVDFCAIFSEALARQLPFGVAIGLDSVHTARPERALDGVPDTAIGYRVVVGSHDTETLVVLARPLARGLINGLFGEKELEVQPQGDLTAAELTVLKYLMEILSGAVTECRIDAQQIPALARKEVFNMHRVGVFRPGDNVVVCKLHMEGAFGRHDWFWLIPYRLLAELFEPEKRPGEVQSPEQRASLEMLVQHMRTEFYTRLGRVRLNPQQIRSLKEGDLVILDQRVSDPLPTLIGGEETYAAWPGRVGNRQAVQIARFVRN